MTASKAAIVAFREAYMRGDWLDSDDWDDPDGRRLRYNLLWANYDNTAYRNKIHTWANLYKAEYAVYTYVRRLIGVPYRLGTFWQSYLWGGMLDVKDGQAGIKGALPIITDNEALRVPIASIWRWSNWNTKKDIASLWGSVLGDAFIRIRDDTVREKVYLELVHPGTIEDVEKDNFGNVKGYTIVETRQDPDSDTEKDVEYREIAEREGGRVVFSTFRDGSPFDWREYEPGDEEIGPEWAAEYDFIPMVHILHNDVGLDWGVGEVSQALEKIREIDDGLSLRSDQMRKTINPVWLFSGVKEPRSGTLTFSRTADTTTRPEAGREDKNALYSTDPSAKAQALVATLDTAGAIAHIQQIIDILEDDYPELRFERLRRGGVMSGMAIRLARQPTVTKVELRRPLYDGPLVRAQQMAVAIGGMRGYEDFIGFDLDSFAAGALNHMIGERPVFKPDPAETSELSLSFWAAADAAAKVGVDLDVYLEEMGWPQEKIDRIIESDGFKAKQEQRAMGALGLASLREENRE